MKRYLSLILWGLLIPLLATAQTPGYDPTNPPNPGMPEDDDPIYYKVICEAIPDGTGSFSYTQEVMAGKKTSVTAYDHDGCYFYEWRDAAGNTLTTDKTYRFDMPASNVKLYALYTYEPDSPANPVYQGKYMLTLKTDPEYGGSFNRQNGKVLEATTVDLYAYSNPGFKFKYWEEEGVGTIDTRQSFPYFMPSHPVTLIAHYDYDPEAPANPGTNNWDVNLGLLTIDCFKPGQLMSAMDNMVGSSNRSKVSHLIVDGEINTNDFGWTNYYKNVNIVDLSRVDGITKLPSYTWRNNTSLQKIMIPACINIIESYCFEGCTNLKTIECYATVPPEVKSKAFDGIPEDCIIYVPEESVPLYQAADVWKNYTITPLLGQFCSLELNLPAECSDGRYKNMTMEIFNVKSGARNKYVVTDRLSYTFNNLIRNTKYIAYLRNLSGHIIGQIGTEDNPIVIDEDNKHADFTDLRTPRTLNLSVQTPEGSNVTSDATITWKDAAGNLLTKGSELTAQLAGYDVRYDIVIPQTLAVKYCQPEETVYTVIEGDNDITYTLTKLPSTLLKGKVENGLTGQPVGGVNVAVSQVLNGQYSVSLSTTTDNSGNFSIEVFRAPTNVTFSANDFVNVDYEFAAEDFTGDEYVIEKLVMNPISGVVADVKFTYSQSYAEGFEIETLPYYSDYKNVSYTLFNATSNQSVAKFSAQYPQIVVVEGAGPGDEILFTAHSTNGVFDDVTVSATVDANNHVSVTFPLVERGGLFARFLVTDNVAVEGILYDKDGNLLDHTTYNTNFTQYESELGDMLRHDKTPNYVFFPQLENGDYTLVTMGKSSFFNSISTISNLYTAGLEEGKDFVRNDLKVESGHITAQRNVVVPFFDESKLYYTGKNTSFGTNRAQVIAGNYITLNARVDFLEDYREDVSDVELIVHLSANAQMVEGSAIVGKAISSYEYRDNTVTIPLGDDFNNAAKFCIVPTERGNYSPDAFVRFKLGENTILQPIGSANYTVTDLTIWTAPLISLPTIVIDGNAAAQSDVVVYDGETVIGKVKAFNDGYWYLQTDLQNPRNLSVHNIWAEVTAPSGLVRQTETRPVEYNERSIQAKSVEMTFWNGMPTVQRTIWVGFDLEHVKASAPSYMFAGGTEFVFTADLTNNSPEVVHSCVIRVFTNKHEWVELPASYIPNLDRWVAHSTFDSQHMPIGVRVNVDADISTSIDFNDVADNEEKVPDAIEEILAYDEEVNSLPQIPDDDEPEIALADDNYNDITDVVVDVTVSTDEFYTLSYVPDPVDDTQIPEHGQINMPITDNNNYQNVFYGNNDDVYIQLWIEDQNGGHWAIVPAGEVPSAKPRKARIATELVTELKDRIQKLEQLSVVASNYINTTADKLRSQIVAVNHKLDNGEGDPAVLEAQRFKLSAAYDEVTSYISIVRDLNTLVSFGHYGIKDVNDWQAFIDRLLPCDGRDDAQARALQWISEEEKNTFGNQYIAACDAATMGIYVITNVFKDGSDNPVLSKVQGALSKYLVEEALLIYKHTKATSRNVLRKHKRDRNKWECGYADMEIIDDKWDFSLPYPVVEPIIDPQGYVYEGVSSNRLEGVTATAYYKHTYEDMYGDLQEEIVKWDATQYGQENPLYTDEQGMYQWDVPQGLWQVKFEKDGYQTAYSEWLPVPPPQMDVNIGMVQNAQPQVISARAFEAGDDTNGSVDVTFSKYMRPATLTADNIYLMGYSDGNETVLENLGITYPDLESTIDESEEKYATTVSIATHDLSVYDEVFVVVAPTVESYAGIQMNETFKQRLDVEKKFSAIAVEKSLNIGYGQHTTMHIGGLPTVAAAGKKIRISSASSLIATLGEDAQESIIVTLDADGQAEFQINGALFGSTALQFQVIGENIQDLTEIHVVDPSLLAAIEAPVASRISGTQVYRGQTVTLSCQTNGASIYYTTDGSCPCESATRQLYTAPIVIDGDLTLRIMAVSYTGEESEVKDYTYSIFRSTVNLSLAEGWNWASHDLAAALAVDNLTIDGIRTIKTEDATATVESQAISGGLAEVQAGAAMKIETTKAIPSITFQGEKFNLMGSTISLHDGWNWIGYPGMETLTLGDALSYLRADEGDVIVGLTDGFSTFTNDEWVGTLKTLTPGEGYLYKSATAKDLIYGTVATENARALYGHRLADAVAPWQTVDSHRYPSVMCLIAQYVDGDNTVVNDDYVLAAFAGDECRGISTKVGDLLFLPIHGDATEALTFRVYNVTDEVEYTMPETADFVDDTLGTVQLPFLFGLGDILGISQLDAIIDNGHVYNLHGQCVSRTGNLPRGIYIQGGKKHIVK